MKYVWATLLAVSACVLGVAGPAYADVRQIGAHSTDATDYYAIGARTTITEPGPIQSYDDASYYSWIGSTLSDGSFYQAGYVRHSLGCAANAWFSQGFDPAGNRSLAIQGGCGLTGTQTFSVEYRGGTPSGSSEWIAYMGGSPLPGSSFFAQAVNSGTQTPFAVSELSNGGLPDIRDTMSGVRYYPALQTKFGGNYYNSSTAAVHRQNSPCPPENTFADGFNNIRAGTGYMTACQYGGLW